MPSFGQKAHFNGPVNQLICHSNFVFAFSVIAFQQSFTVFVDSLQPGDAALTVQVHLNLRVDGKIDGRVGDNVILIIIETNQQQEAGCRRSHTAAGPAHQIPLFRRFFLHQNRIVYDLSCFIMKVGRFQKTAFFVQKDCIAGVAFHNHIIHHTATPFITCVKCPRIISYPLV